MLLSRLPRLHLTLPPLSSTKPPRSLRCLTLASASAPNCTMSEPNWVSLGAKKQELRLEFTLPTGQSFRWRATGDAEYTGVVGHRVVRIRQLEDDVEYIVIARGEGAAEKDDSTAVRDYFNLGRVALSDMASQWASDPRFAAIAPYFPGARVLRQDPLECLFSFICSQNNHILRIHSMVEKLCTDYGIPLQVQGQPAAAAAAAAAAAPAPQAALPAPSPAAAAKDKDKGKEPPLGFYAFPTLSQLSSASEESLRAAGFGYRAKYIVGAAAALSGKEGGGKEWLLALRASSLKYSLEALESVPGVGPKVAACVALFSLDKHSVVPVDTHVWDLALRYYAPELAGKSLTKKVHGEVQAAFERAFGPYCGWAHNALFISELSSMRHRLPEDLRPPPTPPKARKRAKGPAGGEGGEEEEEEGDGATPVASPVPGSAKQGKGTMPARPPSVGGRGRGRGGKGKGTPGTAGAAVPVPAVPAATAAGAAAAAAAAGGKAVGSPFSSPVVAGGRGSGARRKRAPEDCGEDSEATR